MESVFHFEKYKPKDRGEGYLFVPVPLLQALLLKRGSYISRHVYICTPVVCILFILSTKAEVYSMHCPTFMP